LAQRVTHILRDGFEQRKAADFANRFPDEV